MLSERTKITIAIAVLWLWMTFIIVAFLIGAGLLLWAVIDD
jgi:hypothetical protein